MIYSKCGMSNEPQARYHWMHHAPTHHMSHIKSFQVLMHPRPGRCHSRWAQGGDMWAYCACKGGMAFGCFDESIAGEGRAGPGQVRGFALPPLASGTHRMGCGTGRANCALSAHTRNSHAGHLVLVCNGSVPVMCGVACSWLNKL